MNNKQRYIIYTTIKYLVIVLLALVAPIYFIEGYVLPAQVVIFTMLFILERTIVYRNIQLAFKAFEKSLGAIHKLLPTYGAPTLRFDFDFYSPDSAKETATSIQEAIEEVVREQNSIMSRYESLNTDLTHYVNAQHILLSIANEIISVEDASTMYNIFLSKAIELVHGAEKGSMLLLNTDASLDFVAAKGFDLEALKKINLNAYDSFLALNRTQLRVEPYIINDMYQHNNQALDSDTLYELERITGLDIKSTLTAPILVDGEIYGMINLDSSQIGAFKPADITSMLFFTTQLSFAIKNRELVDRTRYLSQYDSLTGIFNRSYFEETFSTYQDRVFKGKGTFLLLIMDLNYLKKINDNFGHNAGDKALRTFVEEIRNDLPQGTVLARYGGDEFIAIMPDMSVDEGHAILDASITRFKDLYIHFNNVRIPIRYSYGIAASPDESMVIDILVKLADQRMYAHKSETKRLDSELFDSVTQNGLA